MDIDYVIRKDEPPAITDTSSTADIMLYERWERSNCLSMMFIETKISADIHGSVDHQDNARDLLKSIDEQFVTLEKGISNVPQVQTGVEQPIIEVPQAVDNIPVDQVVQGFLKLLNNKLNHILLGFMP
ncbi:hypothetical protein ACOSP7_024785 [Xanthoceras sorbifolium]